MLYHPEVFVYLMLLPVTFLVVLPALFGATRTVIGFLRQPEPEEIELYVDGEIVAEV
ncbi:MAG: hypothetical protein Kow0089_22550 [Desulfobulbaceae bacterium]